MSLTPHGSEIQPLTGLPPRRCTNLQGLGQTSVKEKEVRHCGTLGTVIVQQQAPQVSLDAAGTAIQPMSA